MGAVQAAVTLPPETSSVRRARRLGCRPRARRQARVVRAGDGGQRRAVSEQHTSDLIEVRLLDLPLEAYRHTAEHTDELMREFALIRLHEEEGEESSVPSRLLT